MLAHLTEDQLDRDLAQQSIKRFNEKTITTKAALLAELAAIRKRGFSRDDEEHERGIICIAVPILSDRGHLLGGLSVTALQGQKDFDELEKLVPTMQTTAARIAADTENWRFPETNQCIEPMGA